MSNYILNSAWQHERERLESIQAVHDPITTRHLEALGVDKGWRCAEIGAGGGSIARWLAQRTGPQGQVLATDIDTRFLQAHTPAHLEVRQHDIVAESLKEASYDLVHARLLLMHLGDPEQALQHMVAALRPGGYLLVEDADFRDYQVSYPPSDLLSRTGTAIVDLFERGGADPSYGLKLFSALSSLRLLNLGVEGRQVMVPCGTPGSRAFSLLLAHLSDMLIKANLLKPSEIEMAIQELEQEAPMVVYGPIMISAWGRRSSD
jgi:SAM-dependent methyltransferase